MTDKAEISCSRLALAARSRRHGGQLETAAREFENGAIAREDAKAFM